MEYTYNMQNSLTFIFQRKNWTLIFLNYVPRCSNFSREFIINKIIVKKRLIETPDSCYAAEERLEIARLMMHLA